MTSHANMIIRSKIEQAKLQQDNYHHQQLMALHRAKMDLDKQMQSEKLKFEQYKFEQSTISQNEHSNAQIKIAEIQAISQLQKNQNEQTLAFIGMQGKLLEQYDQTVHAILLKMFDFQLSEIMAQNNYQRQKNLMDYEAKLSEMKLRLQQKHEKENWLFSHHARLLEKIIEDKLNKLQGSFGLSNGFSYQKLDECLSNIVQKILSSDNKEPLSEHDIHLILNEYFPAYGIPL